MTNPIFTAVFLWIFTLPALYGFGSWGRRLLQNENAVFKTVFCFSAGLGIFVYGLNALSFAGQFNPYAVSALTGLGFLLFLVHLRPFLADAKELPDLLSGEGDAFARFLNVLLGVSLILTFLLCFLPEVANDALCYQLNIPKCFVRQGSLNPLPLDFNSYTPILMNHLYTYGLLFKSVAGAKLFHWLAGAMLVLLTAKQVKELTSNSTIAAFAALSLLLMPTVFNEITSTYVDLGAGLFFFLCFLFVIKGFEKDLRHYFLLAGLFCGFAVGTKVLHLIGGVPLGLVYLYYWFRQKKVKPAPVLFFLIGLLAGCGWWFVRNWVAEGNPVFPYLGSVFGTYNYSFVDHFKGMGPAKNLLNYLLLPVNMVLRPDDYDRGYWIGPHTLLLVPFLIYGLFSDRRTRPYGLFCWGYITVWFLFFHNARFLTPVYPVFFVGAALGMHQTEVRLGSSPVKYVLRVLYTVVLLLLFAGGLYHYRSELGLLSRRVDTATYLSDRERSFPAAQWVNSHLPADAKIFNAQEIRQFYFERDMTREVWFWKRIPEEDRPKDASSLYQLLKDSGYTHVLRVRPLRDVTVDAVPLDEMLNNPEYALRLASMESKNTREERYGYKIYALK